MSGASAGLIIRTIEAKERELYALRRDLARFRNDIRLPPGPSTVVRCRVSGCAIGFCAVDIDEVVAMAALAELPGAPPWIAGLLQVGADRMVVVDLAVQSGFARRVVDPSQFLVLARADGRRLALIVDSLDGLATIDSADVHRPSGEVPFAPHVIGVTTIAGDTTLILSVGPLGSDLPNEGSV